MNAYELADSVKLIYTDNPLAPTKLFVEVESMLRQQQAEIASLQKNLDVALMIVNKPKLTDEEILKLEEIEFDNYCVDKESKGRKTATITDPEWAIWFARAILRKASEK